MPLTLSKDDMERAAAALQRCRQDPVEFARAFFGIEAAGRQGEYLRMTGKVQVAIAGRRFGKTACSLIKAVHACLTRRDQQWFVAAPSLDQAAIYFRELQRRANENPLLRRCIVPTKQGELIAFHPFPKVTFKSGSVLEARSTSQDGRYLRGRGADGICITEAAFVKGVVWDEVIRAMLLDRQGTAIVESTPNGTGDWTHRLYRMGQEAAEDGYYRSFHATCYDNPRLDEVEIERIRREIPDLAFRQEYLAEWTDDDSAVFPWAILQEVFDDYSPAARPLKEHRYSIGVDVAKHQDWTVICVLDTTETPFRVAEFHRFQGVPYTDVAARCNEVSEKYGATVHLDATGVGDAVAEQIANCRPIVFTPKLREDLISRLVVTVEQRAITLPSSLTELRDEMRYFRRVEHGERVRAEHPQGMHDDAVFGLALSVFGANAGWVGLTEYYRRLKDRVLQRR